LLYLKKGDSAAAEPLLQRALVGSEKVFGPDHPNTLVIVNNLAMLYKARKDYPAAERLLERALAIRRKLAADFPTVPAYRQGLADGHSNLGNLLKDLGKRAEAEAEYGNALAISQQIVADFPAIPAYRHDLAASYYNLACLYAIRSGKEADKQQEYADRAMELLQKAVKTGYADTAHMAKDTDLDPLRNREDFKKLLASPPELAPPPRGANP
jgi:tetratricopeptide (TPR) repeat protein